MSTSGCRLGIVLALMALVSMPGTARAAGSPDVAALQVALQAAGVYVGEDVFLPVGHDGLERLIRVDVLAADHEGDLDPVALELAEPLLQLCTLRRARRVVLDGLVSGLGRQ